MRVAIPAYSYPAKDNTYWPRVLAIRPAICVINPASGPGEVADPNYQQLCVELMVRQIKVLGYIATTWGDKGIWRVDGERTCYLKFYPEVTGFFLDEAATQTDRLFYYTVLLKPGTGGMESLILNPGTMPEKSYLKIPAIKCNYETDFATYMDKEPPQWVLDEPNTRHWWHIVHSVNTAAKMRSVLQTAKRRKCGYIWVTDDVEPNPYDTLPPYLEEMAALARTL